MRIGPRSLAALAACVVSALCAAPASAGLLWSSPTPFGVLNGGLVTAVQASTGVTTIATLPGAVTLRSEATSAVPPLTIPDADSYALAGRPAAPAVAVVATPDGVRALVAQPDGTWSQTALGDTHATGPVAVAVDQGGDAVAVFVQDGALVASFRSDGGLFGAPVTVADGVTFDVGESGPSVALASDDRAYVAWEGPMRLAIGTSAGFSTQVVGASGNNPHVVVDGAGHADLAWSGQGAAGSAVLVASVADDGSIGPPEAVDGLPFSGFGFFADDAGDLVLTWEDPLSTRALLAMRPAGRGWSRATLDQPDFDHVPLAALAPDGTGVVVDHDAQGTTVAWVLDANRAALTRTVVGCIHAGAVAAANGAAASVVLDGVANELFITRLVVTSSPTPLFTCATHPPTDPGDPGPTSSGPSAQASLAGSRATGSNGRLAITVAATAGATVRVGGWIRMVGSAKQRALGPAAFVADRDGLRTVSVHVAGVRGRRHVRDAQLITSINGAFVHSSSAVGSHVVMPPPRPGVTRRGGASRNHFVGGARDDTLIGGGGADTLDGWTGADTLDGGPGRDRLLGGSGSDRLTGADGDDRLDGGENGDVLDGGTGADRIDAGPDPDVVRGGDGDDRIEAGSGNDLVDGAAGDDELDGGPGSDALFGGDGSDTLVGGSVADRLYGGPGDDVLVGGTGRDVLDGGDGDDVVVAENEPAYGGPGNDRIYGGSRAYCGPGDDTWYTAVPQPTRGSALGCEHIVPIPRSAVQAGRAVITPAAGGRTDGTPGRDFIDGKGGADRIFGGAGDDVLWGDAFPGDAARDRVDGGPGDDTIYGGGGADVLLGGPGGDYLEGNSGADRLDGGPGDDEIRGDQGNDRVSGGAGDDLIRVVGGGRDVVDCGPGRDTVEADRSDVLRGCERVRR
jgi:Ca2+-binding RTX toxin-like protein